MSTYRKGLINPEGSFQNFESNKGSSKDNLQRFKERTYFNDNKSSNHYVIKVTNGTGTNSLGLKHGQLESGTRRAQLK